MSDGTSRFVSNTDIRNIVFPKEEGGKVRMQKALHENCVRTTLSLPFLPSSNGRSTALSSSVLPFSPFRVANPNL